MLNEGDIELIHEWRDEMLSHRQRPVTVFYLEKQRDPLTGAVIGEQEESREVIAVVTEISIKNANGSRSLDGSLFHEEGDIQVDMSIELVSDIAKKIERIEHDGGEYEVLGVDKKGIGRRNRYEFIGREIARSEER